MADVIDSDPDELGFSIKTAYYLCQASYAAYGGTEDWAGKLDLGDSLRAFDCGQFHGFVATQKKVALVALRGTQTIGNFLTDVETPLVKHAAYPGLVHYGFAKAADDVWPAVHALLETVSSGLPVWVTGHSLGGAMATLISIRLVNAGFEVRSVYSYGSPRAGDHRFRAAYPLINYRFVNNNDLIPHLPFRWCYRHVGDLKLLAQDGSLIEEDQAWKSKKRQLVKHAKHVQRAHKKSSEVTVSLKFGGFDWLADHHLDRYLAGIANHLPRIPWRRHPDFLGEDRDGIPLHTLHRPAASSVPRPRMLDRKDRQRSAVTETDLRKAFFDQHSANHSDSEK